MAISLANTVQQGETLSGFQDEELFERLFQQRQDQIKNCLFLPRYVRLFIHLKAQILIPKNQSLSSWHPSSVNQVPNCIEMLVA